MLARSFPWLPGAADAEPGGALHVARLLQGGNRHDNPARYGVLYASRDPVSAAAERLRAFRRWEIADADFLRPDGSRYALAMLDDSALSDLVDLDDPATLVRRGLRPSSVATRDRRTTRRIALDLFDEGADGFAWWSTIEAAWINVSLFAERAASRLVLAEEPQILSTEHAAVRAAAQLLGLALPGHRPSR
jgi:hypothetical protein